MLRTPTHSASALLVVLSDAVFVLHDAVPVLSIGIAILMLAYAGESKVYPHVQRLCGGGGAGVREGVNSLIMVGERECERAREC